jgi:hypothetical protein
MVRGAGSCGKVDWASAEVIAGTLTLPLTGELSRAWAKHLAELTAVVEHHPSGWGSIEVTRKYVKVDSVRHGAAPDLHRLLEYAVTETNADFAPAGLVPVTEHEDRVRSGSVAGSVLLVALAMIAVALQWTSWAAPVRPIIVVTFITIGPGWAILRLWGLASGWAGLALVIATSLSLAMIVSGLMLYAGAWSPFASLVALASVTVGASTISLVRARRDSLGVAHEAAARERRWAERDPRSRGLDVLPANRPSMTPANRTLSGERHDS